jgi:hypothetical protein
VSQIEHGTGMTTIEQCLWVVRMRSNTVQTKILYQQATLRLKWPNDDLRKCVVYDIFILSIFTKGDDRYMKLVQLTRDVKIRD